MIKTFIFLTAIGLIQGAERSLTEPHSACPATGHALLPHEYDCTKFYYCEGGQKFVAARDCPPSTEFSAAEEVCIHPELANCKLSGVPNQEAADENDSEVDSCEYLDNGCPADFSIHLLLPHETSCRKFYYCVNGEKVLSQCNRGSVFNPDIQNCAAPGSIDRTCEEEDSSSEEDQIPEDNQSSEEIVLLPNGCPANWNIFKYLPHEYYCNKYYQCMYGELVERLCASGTHFNPATQRCDHPSVVGCTLAGGDASNEEVDTPVTPEASTRPPMDLLDNGCPVDGSITWMVSHEDDCSKFYHCVWGSLVQASCPAGLHFSLALQRCESPAIAGCVCGGDCSEESEENDTGCTGNECNNEPSSEEDLPVGDDPNDCGAGNDCNNECTGNDCNAVSSSEEDLPVGDDPNDCGAGNDCNNECTGNDCNNVSSSEEDLPVGDDPNDCGAGNDCNNECTGNDCNNVSSSEEDLPVGDDPNDCGAGNDCNNECTGNDCNNVSSSEEDLPVGDDPNDCGAGNDCNNECTGSDCNTDSSSEEDLPVGDDPNDCSTGNDCNNECTGNDCDNQCIGNDCNTNSSSEEDLPVGDDPNDCGAGNDCNNDESGCTGNDCDNQCTGNDCNSNDSSDEAGDETNEPDCPLPVDPQQKCEEECNVLPWAHDECDKYWKCDGKQPILTVCSQGLHFNPNTYTCDYACNAGCIRTKIQTTAGDDGMSVFIPWNKIDSKTTDLLKMITV